VSRGDAFGHNPRPLGPGSDETVTHAQAERPASSRERQLLEYPDRFDVRYVTANGGIRWNSRSVNVSIV